MCSCVLIRCLRFLSEHPLIFFAHVYYSTSISALPFVVQVYDILFESRFLRETEEYYAAEGVRYMATADVPHFLQHVEERLQQVSFHAMPCCRNDEGCNAGVCGSFSAADGGVDLAIGVLDTAIV